MENKHTQQVDFSNSNSDKITSGTTNKPLGEIKYDYNWKHYFGIISAENEEQAREILHKDHTGNGYKLCNWSKTTKKDCQTNCKLNLKIK